MAVKNRPPRGQPRGVSLRNDSTGVRVVADRTGNAAQVLGPITPGVSVTGVTDGQFSAIDMMQHMVNELAPADVCVTAWATGIYDIRRVKAIKMDGRISRIRFLVDRAPFERSPKFAGMLIGHLGVEAFRAAYIHSKVMIVSGERGRAVLRTSAGFNRNIRTEQFDLDVDNRIEAFYRDWFDRLWDASGRQLDNREIFQRVYDRYQEGLAPNGGEAPSERKDAGQDANASPTHSEARDVAMTASDIEEILGMEDFDLLAEGK